MLIAKLLCRIFGHKRGRKIGQAVKPDGTPHYAEFALYECPRCNARWNRRVSPVVKAQS